MNWNISIEDTTRLSSGQIRLLRDCLCDVLNSALENTYYSVVSAESKSARHGNKLNMYKKGQNTKVCEIFILKESKRSAYDWPVSVCTNDLVPILDSYLDKNPTEHSREDHTANNWSQKIRYIFGFEMLDELIVLLGGKSFIGEDIPESILHAEGNKEKSSAISKSSEEKGGHQYL